MGSEDQVYVWMGSYANATDAEADYKAVEQLHSSEKLGSYDYAVVEKDAEGNVHVHKHEKPTQHGTWWGIAATLLPGLVPSAAQDSLDKECARRSQADALTDLRCRPPAISAAGPRRTGGGSAGGSSTDPRSSTSS